MVATNDMLWLAVRLPHLYIEALGHSYATQQSILVDHKQHVWDYSQPLEQQKIQRGMPTSTAQLRVDAQLLTLNNDVNTHVQKQLMEQFYQLTPYVQIYEVMAPCGVLDTGFLLELSRCLKLFKGVNNLIKCAAKVLHDRDLSFCFGLAHTQQAAWLLSYTTVDYLTIDVENLTQKNFVDMIEQLPVDVMYAFPKQVEILKGMGFNFFADIAKQVKKDSFISFRQRFDGEFCDALEEMLVLNDSENKQVGLFNKPVNTFIPASIFCEELQFDFPVSNAELLRQPMQQLLQKLGDFLALHQLQTQTIEWRLLDIYHSCHSIVVQFDRLHSHWLLPFELSVIQLENQSLPFEVDTLQLVCSICTEVDYQQRSLMVRENQPNDEEYVLSTARIIARLGKQNLFKLDMVDSHIPEYAVKSVECNQHVAQQENLLSHGQRPSWLFKSPQKIRQKKSLLFWQGDLTLIQGPERIEGHWWDEPIKRDYYVAERSDATRLWVFHDVFDNQWFVHGVFA